MDFWRAKVGTTIKFQEQGRVGIKESWHVEFQHLVTAFFFYLFVLANPVQWYSQTQLSEKYLVPHFVKFELILSLLFFFFYNEQYNI